VRSPVSQMAAARTRDESGNILVIFALLLPMFLMVCAIVIDVGWWWANGKRAQIAADSCALAAASKLPKTYADTECVIEGATATPTNPDWALENLPQKGLADEPRHLGTSVISPYLPENAAHPADSYVEAKVTIAVRTFFGRIINKDFIRITRRAVAESAPGDMAIYARSKSCTDIGVRLNGENMDIDGGVWSNGSFTANGNNIDAESTDVGGVNNCAPQTSSCPGCDLGNGNATPNTHTEYLPWPVWFEQGEFSCLNGGGQDTLKFESGSPYVSGSTINSGTYCATKEIIVDIDGLHGTVTFLAPKVSLKKGHHFTAHSNGVVIFATGTDELVLNTDNTTFVGFIFHPGNSVSATSDCPPGPQGRILINGENNTVDGMLAGCEVHTNGKGLNVTGKSGKRAVSLYE
jgi:hypothetical protein